MPILFAVKYYAPLPDQPRLARDRSKDAKSFGKVVYSYLRFELIESKKAKLSKASFVIPPVGYKKVKDQNELYSDDFVRSYDMAE